jgi:hypothetical protein
MPFDGHRTCAEIHPQLDGFLEFRNQRSRQLMEAALVRIAASEGTHYRRVGRH